MQLTEDVRKKIIQFQQTEITEYHIYKRLAKRIKSPENAKILEQIAEDEKRHYEGWKKYSNKDVQPRWLNVWFYTTISLLFGFTFGIKLMEQGEETAQGNYMEVAKEIPEAAKYQQEENVHEEKLIAMLDEERLQYAGSVVLGLNDALVELTGALSRASPHRFRWQPANISLPDRRRLRKILSALRSIRALPTSQRWHCWYSPTCYLIITSLTLSSHWQQASSLSLYSITMFQLPKASRSKNDLLRWRD